MSLRQRLVLIVCLAVIALMTAGATIVLLVRESDAARTSAAVASTDAAADALARRFRDGASETPLSRDDSATQERLRGIARAVTEPLVEGGGGYCTRDGFVLAEVGPVPRFTGPPPVFRAPSARPSSSEPGPRDRDGARHGRPPGPPPEIRELLHRACADAVIGRVDHRALSHPSHTLVVSLVGIDDATSGWALMRVPKNETEGRSSLALLAMALVTIAMVGVSLDASLALKRGASELEGTVHALETDLRADVKAPRAAELARIAESLRAMASHLAEARDRERALERRLSHEARLSGLGRLVAGVAHEIRNPLTGLKLKLDVMARRPLDDRSAADVATCLREAARIDAVISSVLGVARTSDKEPERVDLASLCDDRAAVAGEYALSHGVTISRVGGAHVSAEPELVARVLDNLIRNAIEASPHAGKVEIVVEGRDDGAAITVVDAGDGIPTTREAELFEPFFTLKPDGTGLGLWMSRALVEARGGTLEYARRDGRTRFALMLPSTPRVNPDSENHADPADRG